jgi:SAM-dependent MidA family methyltransferase
MAWINDEIEARGGTVPFDAFMELALYHPQHGYYSAERPRHGRDGDFMTAPSASAWYARVVGRFLGAVAAHRGGLRLLDLASGDGAFIAEVLASTSDGPTIDDVVSVERSQPMRRLQRARFASAAVPVTLVADLDELDLQPMVTIAHASELYDALPVARVVGVAGGVEEWWVAVESGELSWRRRPPRPSVAAYLERRDVTLEDGQIAEINLGAEGLHREVLSAAGRDAVAIVLDYGYETRRLYNRRGRRSGSLSTFRDHQVGRDPFVDPGEVDLTAHVNWDDLRLAAADSGWTEVGLWPLAEFLVRAGLEAELAARGLGIEAELDADTVSARQEVKRLLDPEGMGGDLKVLVQAKGNFVEVASAALELD